MFSQSGGIMKVEIIASLEKIQDMSSAWNGLLAKSGSNTIFLTHEWMTSWIECFMNDQCQLFVLAVYDRQELVGVAPWYIRRRRCGPVLFRQIEFVGTPEAGSDYLDVFIKRGREKDVAQSLYHFILEEASSEWDVLMLHDLRSDSLFLLHFANRILEQGKYLELTHGSFCPIVFLPKTADAFLMGLSAHRRSQFKRYLKLLNQDQGFIHETFSAHEELARAVETFSLFYTAKKHDGDEQLPAFLKRLTSRCSQKGLLQIDLLTSGAVTLAALFHLRYQEKLYLYAMVTDKEYNPKVSIGNTLVGLCLQQAIAQGITVYDFLKGAEDYKLGWSNGGQRAVNICFFQRKPVSVLVAAQRFSKRMYKVALR